MARITEGTSGGQQSPQADETPINQTHIIDATGQDSVTVPDSSFIANAAILREGMDLVLQLEDGREIVVADYFAQPLPPTITSPEGAQLSPGMVHSFVQSAQPQYAQTMVAADESPVGTVSEVSGQATVIRANGHTETVQNGTPIYEGDIIETTAEGAVNIIFADETRFAVSNNARLAIDEYVFDPASQSGETHFSVLRGMFVFVSGLIGRDDPDDVEIDTPVGSIGIRGTTIAGNVDTGEITVIEGAIVLRSPDGRSEITLAQQFETAKFNSANGTIDILGVADAQDIATRFSSMSDVNPSFFTGMTPTADSAVPAADPAPDAPYDNNTAPAPHGAPPNGSSTPDNTAPDNTAPDNALPDNAVPDGDQAGEELGLLPGTEFDGGADAGFADRSGTDTGGNGLTSPVGSAAGDNGRGNGMGNGTGNDNADSADSGSDVAAPIPPQVPATPPGALNGGGGGTGGSTGGGNGTSVTLNLHALATGDGIRFAGANAGDYFGASLAGYGDYNGDGLADFMIASTPASGNGTVQIYSGNGGTIGNETIGGPATGARIAMVGDMDGDGVGDYAIGAPGLLGGDGFAEIIRSGASSTFANLVGDYELGASIAGIGDINGDGYNDVLIGAPGANGDQGKAVLVYGGASMSSTLDFADNYAPGIPDFQSYNQGFVMGDTGLSRFGADVAGTGDFNNDGYADFMMSDPGNGNVYIGFGGSGLAGLAIGSGTVMTITGLTATATDNIPLFNMGDMNGDGLNDIALGDGAADGGRGMIHVVYGNAGHNGGTTHAVGGGGGFTIRLAGTDGEIAGAGSAGDFDGDGINDMAIAVNNGTMIDIYVIYGRSGLSGTIELTQDFIRDNGFHIQYDPLHDGAAPSPDGHYDIELHSPGDVDGDGYDDLLIGSPNHDNNTGEAYLIYGRNGGGAIDGTTATADGQSLVGTTGNDIFSNPDFSGLHMHGGAGDDRFDLYGSVRTLDGGAGDDVVRLMSDSMVLDFAALSSGAVSGVETFMLTGMNQTLRLGLDDIFRLLQESDDGTLTIDSAGTGNQFIIEAGAGAGADEFLNLSSNYGFDHQGVHTDAGVSYDAYAFGSYTLLIDQNVAAEAV